MLPKLNVTGGLRYTMDRTSADGRLELRTTPPFTIQPPNPQKSNINKLTFKGAIDYTFADGILGYLSFSRGFKSNSFNLLTYSPIPNKPEVLDDLEGGFKADFFDKRVRLNVAGFRYWLKDPQVQLIRVGSVVISNADSARVYGGEFDLTALLVEGLTARVNGTYLHSTYKKYTDAPSGAPQPGDPPFIGARDPLASIDASGNFTSRAPKFSGDVGFDYALDTSIGKFLFTGDYYHNSGYFYEPDNFIRQKSFNLLNGQIKFSPTEQLAVRAYARNIAGKKYTTYSGAQAGPAGYPYIAGPPRTYGVAVDFTF